MKEVNWKNWSGSLSFSPGEIAMPESEEQVAELVKTAGRENRNIRVVGAGHSSSPLVKTKDILLSLKHFQGSEDPDPDSECLTILGGMTVKEAGKEAYRYGLGMHNTGDVDVQTIAGAIGTGTHGTGVELKNLSSMLAGVKMVTGTGEILQASIDNEKELFRALQVAMGTCGVFLKMRLQLEKAYRLHRKEWCVPIEKCLSNLDDLKKNRNFDFYWYPRSDLAKIRVMNEEGKKMPEISYGRLEMEKKGNSHEILPRSRQLKFDEMEYVLPADKAVDCFLEVRNLIKKHWRKEIAWRILFRTIKSDNVYISPMTGRESVTISLHHNAGMRFWHYFKAIEPIFIKFGGRPHWGKKHTLKAKELREMYPHWDQFQEIRKEMDPNDVFLSPYMKELLIAET